MGCNRLGTEDDKRAFQKEVAFAEPSATPLKYMVRKALK